MRTSHLVLAVALTAVAIVPLLARAHDGCCSHCGCAAACHKVCRLECGEKKVEIICWGCKCEDFCIPCKSKKGCKHCETVCDDCEADREAGVCAKPKNFVWFDWMPGGATIRTKTKLMKKIETVTVPSYKWVVEDMCPKCAANAAATKPDTIVYAAPTPAGPPTIPAEDEKSPFNIVQLPKFIAK
jgi:hypothetical protein